MAARLTLRGFIARWKDSQLSERSAAQSHFIDLCEALGEDRPAAVDQTGESFTFEKGLKQTGGAQGWADVWKRHHLAWEYKGSHKDLDTAYRQLQLYQDDLAGC
jgi:hypothetical protein